MSHFNIDLPLDSCASHQVDPPPSTLSDSGPLGVPIGTYFAATSELHELACCFFFFQNNKKIDVSKLTQNTQKLKYFKILYNCKEATIFCLDCSGLNLSYWAYR